VEFYRILNSIPITLPAAGHLFETWSHGFISRGGKVVLQQMKDDGTHLHIDDSPAAALTMELDAMPLTLYHRRDEVSTTGASDKYYIPSATSNFTFDSFFVTGGVGIGVQMTLAATRNTLPQARGFEVPQGTSRRCYDETLCFRDPQALHLNVRKGYSDD
jgi:hypothetical protein